MFILHIWPVANDFHVFSQSCYFCHFIITSPCNRYAPLREESRRLEIASDNVYSIFRKTNEMKSDLAWKREWEANVREKARQEQARQEQRERQPKRKKRSYDMSL